jgi:hypothetical protein
MPDETRFSMLIAFLVETLAEMFNTVMDQSDRHLAHVQHNAEQDFEELRQSDPQPVSLGYAELRITKTNWPMVFQAADKLIAAGDGSHLFYEQLKQIHYALRTINPEDIDDATLEDILDRADRLAGLLRRISGPKKKSG